MVVVPLPGVVVVVEDEVAREKEDLWPHFAALAHPLTVQAHGQVGSWRQDGRVELVRAVDDPTDDAAMVVVLKTKRLCAELSWKSLSAHNVTLPTFF